jgi:hypothetical protein
LYFQYSHSAPNQGQLENALFSGSDPKSPASLQEKPVGAYAKVNKLDLVHLKKPLGEIRSHSITNFGLSPISPPCNGTYLPPDLRDELSRFRIDGYARKFFATHKKGFFRRRVPLEKMLVWSKVCFEIFLMYIY